MQQIERYGVIALVFLLVTIVAISFWGDSKSPGFWSRLMGRDKQAEVAKVDPPTQLAERVARGGAPLSPNGLQQLPTTPPPSGAAANVPTSTDMPASGNATIGAPLETPAALAQQPGTAPSTNAPPANVG